MSGPALGQEPVRLAPVDLAAAFAPAAAAGAAGETPDRAAGLRGLALARRAPASEPAPTADGAAAPPVVDAPPPGAPDQRAPGPAPRVEPVAGERPESPTVTIVVYVPVSVRERLRAFHANSPETYTTIVLDAVESTVSQLPALLEPDRPVAREDALFSHRGGRRRVRHEEAQVQVSLRPAREDLAVLDRLAAECAAPSRSALVAAALDRYLPALPSRR